MNLVLQAGGFGLVAFDLADVPPQEATLVVERIRTGGRDDPARLRLDLRQPE